MIIQVAKFEDFCKRMRNSKILFQLDLIDLDTVLLRAIKLKLASFDAPPSTRIY